MTQPIQPTEERFQELRACFQRLDPTGKRPWILEILDETTGKPVMSFNIKNGQPVSNRRANLSEKGR